MQPPSSDLEDEIIPDSELEFQDLEVVAQNESSEDSGDDFVPGETSQSDVPQEQDSDVPLRLTTAVASTSTRPSSSKAGTSSKIPRGRKSTALALSEAESSDSSDAENLFAARKVPRGRRAAPTRGMGRRGAPQFRRPSGPRRRRGGRAESDESDQESGSSDVLLEPSDDDAKPPPKGLQPHETHALIKAAHRRMRKKLGRKLTIVGPSIAYPRSPLMTIVLLFSARQVNGTTPPFSSRTEKLLGRSQEVHRNRYSGEGKTT